MGITPPTIPPLPSVPTRVVNRVQRTITSASERLAELLHISVTKVKAAGSIAIIGAIISAGIRLIGVGEYAFAMVPWLMAATFATAFLWPDREKRHTWLLRVGACLCGLVCLAVLVAWTVAKKSNEPWTNFSRLTWKSIPQQEGAPPAAIHAQTKPAAELIYDNETHRLRVHNTGTSRFLVSDLYYGDEESGEGSKTREHAIVEPGFHYYFFAEHLEGDVRKALAKSDKDMLIPCRIYLLDPNNRVHKLTCRLLARKADGTIHAQTLDIE